MKHFFFSNPTDAWLLVALAFSLLGSLMFYLYKRHSTRGKTSTVTNDKIAATTYFLMIVFFIIAFLIMFAVVPFVTISPDTFP